MNFLYDLPPEQRQRLAEVMADPKRRASSVHHQPPPYPRKAACGTRAGYERHRRLKEETCEECKAAERNRQRGLRV